MLKLKKQALYPLLVFFVPFLVYLPTLLGSFYYDDNVIFLGHQAKHLAEDPFSVFKSGTHGIPGAPRSLHVFFLLLLFKVFGPWPLPFHFFNLVFHAATCLVIFATIKRLSKNEGLALLSGLVFGLHPAHVENITFVTLGGTDLFYAFWAMLSLLLYLIFRGGKPNSIKGVSLIVLSAATYAFSFLSKESALSFVIVYPMAEVFLKRRGYLWALPHLFVLALMKWGVLVGGASMAASAVSGASAASGGRGLENVFLSLGYFIKTLAVPYPLNPLIKEFGNHTALYAFIAVFAAAITAYAFMKNRPFVFGGVFFLAASLPYLFVPFVGSNVAITADRYMYAPSIGFALMLASALGWIKNANIKKAAASAVFVTYALIGVFYFYSAWRTEEAFWKYSAKMNPDYVSSYVSLAGIELEKGDVEGGRRLLEEGLSKPKGMPAEYAQAAHVLGGIALDGRDLRLAESYLLLSIRYSSYEFAFIDLGFLYLETGNPERAKWAFENALRFPARSLKAAFGLAKSLELLGDKEAARVYAARVYNESRDEALRAAAAEILK